MEDPTVSRVTDDGRVRESGEGSGLSESARAALLSAYAAIDAEGGNDPDASPDYAEGFRVGLELALVKIDQMLNADAEPDEAWIAEGLNRLRARLAIDAAFASDASEPPRDPPDASDEYREGE